MCGWARARLRLVMVCDNHIHAEFVRAFHLSNRLNPAVYGNEQVCAFLADFFHRLVAEPIAVIKPIRNVVFNRHIDMPERVEQ